MPPVSPRDGLGDLIGLEYLELKPHSARARVAVSDDLRQPAGLVHGGVYGAIAESLCSRATHEAVTADGMVAMGQSNQATYLRPVSGGHVNATATARHRGRTTWIWDVELEDDDARTCALVRIIIAVRPAKPPRPGR